MVTTFKTVFGNKTAISTAKNIRGTFYGKTDFPLLSDTINSVIYFALINKTHSGT